MDLCVNQSQNTGSLFQDFESRGCVYIQSVRDKLIKIVRDI